MSTKSKTLILCVDQDDDIGKKGGVQTPVVGAQANRDAAATLAIADPEEADSNAMFGAIKLYKELIVKYPDESFQIATIAGSPTGGVEADRVMVEELKTVLASFDANGIILVTDGFADDVMKPILQSRIPVTSVHHVTVKHSERIEETYAIFGKYLRMIIDDPYYSRILLGVPGILLLIYGFLIASNQLQNAGIAVVFVLGIVFFLKGFGIYDRIVKFKPKLPPPEEQPMYVARIIGGILSVIGIFQGLSSAISIVPTPIFLGDIGWWVGMLPKFISEFTLKSVDLLMLGFGVYLIGGAIFHYLSKDELIGQSIVSLNLAFWVWLIVRESAEILKNPQIEVTLWSPLIFYTFASVLTTVILVFITYKRYKRLPFT